MTTFIQRIFNFGVIFGSRTVEDKYPEPSTALILERLGTFATKIPSEAKDLINCEIREIQSDTG